MNFPIIANYYSMLSNRYILYYIVFYSVIHVYMKAIVEVKQAFLESLYLY